MKLLQDDFNKQEEKSKSSGTIICLPHDIEQIYAFYCSRYENISYKDFLNLGYEEFSIKISSIPESEPFYTTIKARIINLSEIKNKEERRYWRKLKKANRIPDIYISTDELKREIKKEIGGNKNV